MTKDQLQVLCQTKSFFQLLKERGKERRRHKGESAASGRWKEEGEGGEGGEDELLIDFFYFSDFVCFRRGGCATSLEAPL